MLAGKDVCPEKKFTKGSCKNNNKASRHLLALGLVLFLNYFVTVRKSFCFNLIYVRWWDLKRKFWLIIATVSNIPLIKEDDIKLIQERGPDTSPSKHKDKEVRD